MKPRQRKKERQTFLAPTIVFAKASMQHQTKTKQKRYLLSSISTCHLQEISDKTFTSWTLSELAKLKQS